MSGGPRRRRRARWFRRWCWWFRWPLVHDSLTAQDSSAAAGLGSELISKVVPPP